MESVEEIDLTRIQESETNPRTHFDQAYLQQLAGSIRDKGVMQPVVVRGTKHKKAPYELVIGACRFRASKIAGKTAIPAFVREYDDATVLELQLEENIHRRDLTPMDEARGYRALIDSNPTKHSAEAIATRIGMSVGYVWDRLKLNDLIPEAARLLESERITVGHAILISRQTPENQTRIIKPIDRSQFGGERHSALWRDDNAMPLGDDAAEKLAKKDPYYKHKPVSLRELEHWISDHIRFDVAHAAHAQPLQFEDTATTVERAAAQPGRGKKIVAITHEYRVADDARDAKERTYGSQSWRRADGQAKSKPCEYSVLGVVAAGEGYGTTLQVCVNRDKCEVHFGKEIRDRAKGQKRRQSGNAAGAQKREAEQYRRAEEKRKADEREWATQRAGLIKDVQAACDAMPKTLPAPMFTLVLEHYELAKSIKPADLAKALLERLLHRRFHSTAWIGSKGELVSIAKKLGVDVNALEPALPKKPAKAKKLKKAS